MEIQQVSEPRNGKDGQESVHMGITEEETEVKRCNCPRL